MNSKDKILSQLFKAGYTEAKKVKLPTSLLWQPDLIFTKNSETYYVLLRSTNTILPSFLSRISNSSSKCNSLIIFEKKCSKTEENQIISFGISVGYFIQGKLTLKLRSQVKAVAKEAKKKLQVIDIFVSSKQGIKEREFVAGRIEALRKINRYPFNPPNLIEYDSFAINKLYKHIDTVLDSCDWIIIILEDNFSNPKIVRHEIHRAVKKLKHENIFMFVKSTKLCQQGWKRELDFIKALIPPSIKYLPFSDISDLEVTMTKAIHLRMSKIFKKQKIQTVN
ncbi:MAG: hypothetical protein WCM76_16045 [Bacteroidota bacterium]